MARRFKYGENEYDDPGEEFSIDEVKQHLAQFFPELAQATHSEKKLPDGTAEITFAKKVGTKGSGGALVTVQEYPGLTVHTLEDLPGVVAWPAWTPVDAALPEIWEDVLVYTKDETCWIACLEGPTAADWTAMDGCGEDISLAGVVTHWMPLPPRPGAMG